MSADPACDDEAAALDQAATLAEPFEGYSAVPYLCPAHVWTIGWGSTRDANGNPVTASTPRTTALQAHALMVRDLRGALQTINGSVVGPLEVHEEAALLSFIYNVGSGAFRSSGLLRAINAGDFDTAAAEFDKWNRGGGKVLAGLTRRRAAERALFDQS